jgi:hypothetical protein
MQNVLWYQSFLDRSLTRIQGALGHLDTALWHVSKQSEFGKLMFTWMSTIDTQDINLLTLRANSLALLADDIEYVARHRTLDLLPLAKRLVHKRKLSRVDFQSLRFELGVGVDLARAGVVF